MTSATSVDAVIANLQRIDALKLAVRVALRYRVSIEALLGEDRHKTPSAARRELWMLLRHTLALSFPELGAVFNRDHSTIITGVHKRERELEAEYLKESA